MTYSWSTGQSFSTNGVSSTETSCMYPSRIRSKCIARSSAPRITTIEHSTPSADVKSRLPQFPASYSRSEPCLPPTISRGTSFTPGSPTWKSKGMSWTLRQSTRPSSRRPNYIPSRSLVTSMTSSTRDSRPRQTRVRGIDLLRTSRRNSHIAVGTGLVSLDVVLAGEDGAVSGMWAGGSCGNVLTILSLLGWSAFPAGRLAQDGPADLIRDDLRKWKVHLDFLRSIPEGSTPVIVERILRTEGKLPSHVYDWRCPSCSSWLPRFKPIGREVVASIIQKVQQPEVFYFDRATPAAVDLATAYRKKGALVVFEPNGIGKEKWFQLAVSSSHVLKYSNEKVGRLGEAVSNVFPPLHVETLGGAGLRYKVGRGNWRSLPAASPPRVKDAAGAGD